MRQGSQSAQTCGCDKGADWVCATHAAKDAEAPQSSSENSQECQICGGPQPHSTGNPYCRWCGREQLKPNMGTMTPTRATTLPLGGQERKQYPVASGVLDYFPDALVAIAHVSYTGNDQHNPGEPLHWAREKSTDQADTLIRHFLERGSIDTDGQRHSAKLAWRALALLQIELEQEKELDEVPF